MKKIWKNWCKMVDDYNSKIDYVSQKERWSYYTPLYPLMLGFMVAIIYVMFSLVTFTPLVFGYAFSLGGVAAIILTILLVIQWKINK